MSWHTVTVTLPVSPAEAEAALAKVLEANYIHSAARKLLAGTGETFLFVAGQSANLEGNLHAYLKPSG